MTHKQLRPSRMLPFDIDPEPLKECLTGRAGLPMVAEAYRALGAEAAITSGVKVKERQRGFSETEMVGSKTGVPRASSYGDGAELPR